MLAAVIVANAIYCVIAGGIALFSPSITNLGRCFFLIEILVVLVLIRAEWNVYKNCRTDQPNRSQNPRKLKKEQERK